MKFISFAFSYVLKYLVTLKREKTLDIKSFEKAFQNHIEVAKICKLDI